jgi:hypothetical protein
MQQQAQLCLQNRERCLPALVDTFPAQQHRAITPAAGVCWQVDCVTNVMTALLGLIDRHSCCMRNIQIVCPGDL